MDLLALARAGWQLIHSGRIVFRRIDHHDAGGTLARGGGGTRSVFAKLREIVRALEIERILSKDEILGLYLSLAPGSGNLEGVRAASLAYLGKEPRRLTLAETPLLVALPQSPEGPPARLRTQRAARTGRNRVLDRLAAAGLVPPDEVAQARREPVPQGRQPMPVLGPHAADQAVAAAPARMIYRLTIDADRQRSLEALAQHRARTLGAGISVAIVAVDHASGELLAQVDRRAGQVDMTTAVRSPGSALKPFI